MLKFKTEGQELIYLDNGTVIVGGTVRYLEAEFDLSDDWKSFPEVTAYFKCGAAINSIILIGGKIKAEDNLALAPGVWSVYLRAYELEGEEIKRQITSSTVKINVLSHGKFTGREFVPENADAYEKRMTEMRNYLVFEEYNPSKKYVKGNKVSYEGSSYVLMSERAQGVNPTDDGVWLLIAEKGKDGELPEGAMVSKGTVNTLPKPSKTIEGDVYKCTKDITEILELIIPSFSAQDVVQTDEFEFVMNWVGQSEAYAAFQILVEYNQPCQIISEGVFYLFNIKSVVKEGEGIYSAYFEFDPAEYNADDFSIALSTAFGNMTWGYPPVELRFPDITTENIKFKSGTLVAFLNGEWVKLSIDEGNFATVDLENVSNEVFRAKAEEAGVGGDAGLAGEGCVMKFMNEVSALPEAANDGDVYSVNPWESAGAYDGSGTEFYDNTARFEGWNALGNALYQDIQYYYAWTYKFVLSNGTELIYKECGISGAGEWGFEMSGYCTDSNINLTLANGEIVDVYRINGEPKDNVSYVRSNGKWIKL